MQAASPPVIGIAGWKNSGKTTLVEGLIAEFTQRGLCVASIKHTHHRFPASGEATDSARHRQAGARSSILAGPNLTLADALEQLAPAGLVIVEGFKSEPIPKIEVRSAMSRDQTRLSPADPLILAIASDEAQPGETLPVLRRDAIPALADLITRKLGLPQS